MERLTQKIDGGTTWATVSAYENSRQFVLGEAINRLAAYEDTGLTPEAVKIVHETLLTVQENKTVMWNDLQKYLQAEADGRLVVLPCKVGDTVYIILDGNIHKAEVYHISYSDYYGKITATVWTKEGVGAPFSDFGKFAFLTREEAEAALKEAGT